MNKIHVEIKAERLRQDAEWGGSTHDDVHEPEKWCGFLRHQLRLADRAACSLATDEITGGEEQALIDAVHTEEDQSLLARYEINRDAIEKNIFTSLNEHKRGVVQKIDESSQQLAEALEHAVPVIITTLQKFPFVSRQLLKMAERYQALQEEGKIPWENLP